MQRMRTLVTFFLVLVLGITQVQSADLATATPLKKLSESFDEAPQSSGIPMVGLRIVSSASMADSSKIDLSEIIVALPSKSVSRICVRVTTQDARYLALNPYRISEVQSNPPRARLKPVSNRYRGELGDYSRSEVAIKSYVANDDSCSPVAVQHLPQVELSNLAGAGSQALEVRVNSRGRDARAILSINRPATTATGKTEPLRYEIACGNTQNRAGLAFDRLCRFQFDDYASVAGTLWTLTLALNDGFADSLHDYSIYLP